MSVFLGIGKWIVKISTSSKRILLNDITECDIKELKECCDKTEVKLSYLWENNLTMKLNPDETFDMTFIDTLHCCGQIKRELEKFSKITNKYILMHDTTVDEFSGEIYRLGLNNLDYYKNITGFNAEDLLLGMSHGINIFLKNNSEWIVKEKFVKVKTKNVI